MTVLSLVPPSSPTRTQWKVVLNDGGSFLVNAKGSFESDSRIYFTDIVGKELTTALNTGTVVSHVLAAFDQEQVLTYYKEGSIEQPTPPRRRRKKT
jgi:hypothetical protein